MAKPDVLEKAQKVLEYRFQNPKLLEAAITHASSASDRLESNERMEFLGDAVLGLIICRRVYELYPDRREGQLTVLKSAVVSRKTCAAVSDTIGLTELIRVGPGMEKPGRLPHSLAVLCSSICNPGSIAMPKAPISTISNRCCSNMYSAR